MYKYHALPFDIFKIEFSIIVKREYLVIFHQLLIKINKIYPVYFS